MTSLYRHYDKDNKLLYVGISLHHINRLSQHKKSAKWYEEIVDIKIEQFKTREEAEDAEKVAIKCEKPKYNIIYNRPTKAPKTEPKNFIPNRDKNIAGMKRFVSELKRRNGRYEQRLCAFIYDDIENEDTFIKAPFLDYDLRKEHGTISICNSGTQHEKYIALYGKDLSVLEEYRNIDTEEAISILKNFANENRVVFSKEEIRLHKESNIQIHKEFCKAFNF